MKSGECMVSVNSDGNDGGLHGFGQKKSQTKIGNN